MRAASKYSVAIGAVAILPLAAPASPAAAATEGDFDCSRKVVAIYQPGPNWSQFRERLAEHLDYIKAKMDERAMTFGSPMSNRSGQPVGGLFVYNEPSLDDVEKLIQDDTFVRNRVVTYSLAFWGMCQRARR